MTGYKLDCSFDALKKIKPCISIFQCKVLCLHSIFCLRDLYELYAYTALLLEGIISV